MCSCACNSSIQIDISINLIDKLTQFISQFIKMESFDLISHMNSSGTASFLKCESLKQCI